MSERTMHEINAIVKKRKCRIDFFGDNCCSFVKITQNDAVWLLSRGMYSGKLCYRWYYDTEGILHISPPADNNK